MANGSRVWYIHGPVVRDTILGPFSSYSQNQNSLLVKRQNDNTSPGLGRGRLVPSSHKESEFRYTVIRLFSRGGERIGEVIPVPDS